MKALAVKKKIDRCLLNTTSYYVNFFNYFRALFSINNCEGAKTCKCLLKVLVAEAQQGKS